MQINVFEETRRHVTAREVAEHCGFEPNRANFISCPFHQEKTASLKLYPGMGGFYCFGCHRGGTVIDFVAALYDLTPLEAVRRLDDTFHLGLPLDRHPDSATLRAAQHRQEISDTYRLFEQWRDGMIQQLTACFRLAHMTMKGIETPADFDRLTDAQALTIREQARLEWLADTLIGGSMVEQMEIFRERGEILRLIEQILSSTPPKSGAA